MGFTLYIVLALVAVAALLVALTLRRGVGLYEKKFVSHVGSGLIRNFVVADPRTLFFLSVLLTVVFGAVGYLWIGPAGAVGATVLAVLAPRIVLWRMTTKRTRQFVYQLPDALLALSSALRAGSSLSKGLDLLVTRQPAPLCQEFSIVLGEHRVGRQLNESLADMRKRVGTPELDMMNSAINISRKVGGNLADTLESLARTLQEKATMEGKIDALTSMGRAQGWVVGCLPIFIGMVLNWEQPRQMHRLFTEWYGWATLLVVALMMAAAAWMIRKIVNIDI